MLKKPTLNKIISILLLTVFILPILIPPVVFSQDSKTAPTKDQTHPGWGVRMVPVYFLKYDFII